MSPVNNVLGSPFFPFSGLCNQGDDRHRPRLAAREPIQLKRATQGTDGHHESAQQPANDLGFLEHLSNLTRTRSATATGSECQSKWKCFNHVERGRAAGSRSVHRPVRRFAVSMQKHGEQKSQRRRRSTATIKGKAGHWGHGIIVS